MARRTVDFTADTGRDKGKQFRIRELPAVEAERWAMRALNTMAKSIGDLPPWFTNSGAQGLAALGMSAFAKAKWEDIEPLIAEMFKTVTIIKDDKEHELLDDEIEEVMTRLQLRQEILELHLGFFKAAVNWILTAARYSFEQQQTTDNSSNA